jgi:hypothetical protein
MSIKSLALILLLSIITSCVMYTKGDKYDNPQQVEIPTVKYNQFALDVAYSVNDFNINNKDHKLVKKVRNLTSKKIVDYNLSKTLNNNNPDIKIKVHAHTHFSQTKAFISGYISGLTLLTIPAFASESIDVKTTILDKHDTIIAQYNENVKLKLIMQNLLIPFSFKNNSVQNAVSDVVIYSLNQAKKDGLI